MADFQSAAGCQPAPLIPCYGTRVRVSDDDAAADLDKAIPENGLTAPKNILCLRDTWY
jgi:hypothetical protein